MSVNKVILIGNLGKDPELRYTQSGKAVANFSIATTERWEKDGKKNENTTWHDIVVWGALAEICEKYLSKGRQVYVEGRLQKRDWEDKDGNKRVSVEVVANDVTFLQGGDSSGASSNGGGSKGKRREKPQQQDSQQDYFNDDDIPF